MRKFKAEVEFAYDNDDDTKDEVREGVVDTLMFGNIDAVEIKSLDEIKSEAPETPAEEPSTDTDAEPAPEGPGGQDIDTLPKPAEGDVTADPEQGAEATVNG